MLVGPFIQDTQTDILMRFRTYSTAFTADIGKMNRQVRVHADDVDMQRILWRESPNQPIQDYTLQTVTYSTAAAPYLTTRALQQLAKDESSSLPLGSKCAVNDHYVDDCLSIGSSDAEDIQKQLH